MSAVNPAPQMNAQLSQADAAELAAGVAELTRAGLPLPTGLRALAEELPGRRVRATLNIMADRLERGEAFDTVMQSTSKNLPPHLHGLLLAGLRTGRLPEVLEEYLEVEEYQRHLRHRLRLSMAYPTLLMAIVTIFAFLARFYLMPELNKIYRDFGSNLPFFSKFVDVAMWQILVMLAGFTAVLLFIPLSLSKLPGARWLGSLIRYIPFWGSLLRSSRLASFSRLAVIFLQHETPLPEALRLAGGANADPRLAKAARGVADELEMGRPLVDAVEVRPQFPCEIVPMLDWGQKNAALPQAFAAIAQTYEGRAKNQGQLIDMILVPITFLLVIGTMGIILSATIMPMLLQISSFVSIYYRPGKTSLTDQIPWNFILSSMFSPFLLGVALLATKKLITFEHDARNENIIEHGLNITGWVLIVVGLGGNLICSMGFFSIPWFFAVAFIGAMIGVKNRRTLQKSLLWIMAASSERFIPLVPSIDAFSQDLPGRVGDGASKIADLLSHGMPLPEALLQAKKAVPRDSLPLIRAGYESGALAQGLREAALAEEMQTAFWASLSGKLFYITALPCFAVGILTFMMIKIIPAFEKIFKDFDIRLPSATYALISLSHLAVNLWYLLIPLIMPFVFLFFYSLLCYCGVPLFDLPGMNYFMWRKHAAAILDALALSIEHDQPLVGAMRSLAECYPKKAIQNKLRWVSFDLERGESPIESLYCRGLISEADFAVLRAAAKVGNLPWAMREMADGNRRRLAYRLNALLQIIFPTIVLLFGAVVLFVVAALFIPIIALINSMAGRC